VNIGLNHALVRPSGVDYDGPRTWPARNDFPRHPTSNPDTSPSQFHIAMTPYPTNSVPQPQHQPSSHLTRAKTPMTQFRTSSPWHLFLTTREPADVHYLEPRSHFVVSLQDRIRSWLCEHKLVIGRGKLIADKGARGMESQGEGMAVGLSMSRFG
jgi:hypothetical protein